MLFSWVKIHSLAYGTTIVFSFQLWPLSLFCLIAMLLLRQSIFENLVHFHGTVIVGK